MASRLNLTTTTKRSPVPCVRVRVRVRVCDEGVLELKLEVLKDGLALPLVDTLSFHKKKNERRSYLEHDLKTTPLAIHLSELREDRPEGRSYSSAIYVRFNVRGKQSERWLLRASVPILGPRVQVDVPLTFHGGKRKAVAPSPSPSPTSSQQLCTPSPSPSPSSSSSSSISASPSSSLPSPSPSPQPMPLQPRSSPAAGAPPSHVIQRLLHLMTPGSAQRAATPAAAQIEPSPPAAVSSPSKPTTTAATATATSPAALPPHTQLMSTRSEVKKVIPDGARLRSLDEKIVVHITGAPHLVRLPALHCADSACRVCRVTRHTTQARSCWSMATTSTCACSATSST